MSAAMRRPVRRGNILSILSVGAAMAMLSACGSGDENAEASRPLSMLAPAAQASPALENALMCDRTCLQGFVDRFLDALVAHDPDKVELAADVRYTENGQDMRVGDGLWNTVSDNTSYRLYMADPQAGEAAIFGVIKENGDQDILALRLKVVDMQVHEAEAIVVRSGGNLFDPGKLVTPRAAFLQDIPADQRPSRTGMKHVANLYFDALQSNDGSKVPFTGTCNRIENGRQMTNNPALTPVPAPQFNIRAMNCHDNMNSRMWAYISRIEPRRFVIADTERGIVLAIATFQHDGVPHPVDVPGVGAVERGIGKPFTLLAAEVFKISDGKIDQIEAVGASLPYGSGTGWDQFGS